MAPSSAHPPATPPGPGAPLSVLIACAPEDGAAVKALAQRLQADGMGATLMAQAASPRALREATGAAEAIIVCLSRRALPEGHPAPSLAHLLDVLALAPARGRPTLALKLTSCEAPAALRDAPTFDLFSASGYERLLAHLRAHAAAIAPAPPPPPAAPEPVPPVGPAVALRGGFGLPLLDRQGQVRRLGRGVARAVFLPDDAHALVISGGGPTLTSLAGGQPLWAIDCPARCAALSPSGRLLALGAGAQIYLWDLADGSLRGVCAGHSETVSGLAFAPDERTLASASHDRSVRLWRTGDDGRPPALLAALPDHTDQATSVAFSPDGALVAAGGADRTVRVWRTLDRARVQTLSGHGGAVEALAFSPDGATLAAGSRGRQARLWETHGWRPVATLEGHEGAVEAVAFSPDSALLATGGTDQRVRLWRREGGALARVLEGHSGPVAWLAFSPDGTTLASVAEDERLIAWRVADGSPASQLRPLSGRVTALAVSPDGEQLAVGAGGGSLTIYGLGEDGGARLRQNEHRGAVVSAAFAGPGQVVSASTDRSVRACAIEGGESSIMLQTHGALHAACLAPNGRLLASSDGESTVQLWRLAGPEATPGGTFWRVLRGMRGRPRLIAFGPDGASIAVSADDGALRLWRLTGPEGDAADPELTVTFGGGRARSLAFSGDGSLVAAGGDGGDVQVWRAAGGLEVGSLAGTGHAATSLAFSPDGGTLATGDASGAIRIWRIGSRETRRRAPTTLAAHAGAVDHLAYSAAGRLISGSADGTVRVWRV